MTGSLTLELQGLIRPDLDEIFAALGQTATVRRKAPVPDGPPPDIDEGVVVLPTGTPVQFTSTYPAFGYQLTEKERSQYGSIGADLKVPLWMVLVHYSADLNVPGFELVLKGGALPEDLPLRVVGDANDLGTQRVCWQLLCQAIKAR